VSHTRAFVPHSLGEGKYPLSVAGDDYETRFMSEGGLVHQAKSKAPAWFHLVMFSPVIVSLGILTMLVAGGAAPPLLLLLALPSLAVTLPLWLLFAVLRATVTTTHVHIQYGLFGPKIPLASIASCEAVTYDWKKYGGWGIRRAADGSWAYNMAGDQGRAVRIEWRDEGGKEVTTLLSARDPEAFVRAVAQAKGRAVPSATRVGAPERADVEAAERELEAELEAEREAEKEKPAAKGKVAADP